VRCGASLSSPVAQDIKLEQLVLTASCELKLVDFGLATQFSTESCHTSRIAGTAGYFPPEASVHHDAKKADCWTVGVCLFVMLFGFPPWTAANMFDKWYKMWVNDRRNYWVNVRKYVRGPLAFPSEDAMELLGGLLNPDPLQRYDMAQARGSKFLLGSRATTEEVQQEVTARLRAELPS
jgi:serine/threonine protein kinase